MTLAGRADNLNSVHWLPRDVKRSSGDAFSLTELLITLAILALFGALLMPALHGNKPRPERVQCANNLKYVGAELKTWAADNGGKFPQAVSTNEGGTLQYAEAADPVPTFLMATNILTSPRLLTCPADRTRKAVNEWSVFARPHLSYFLGVDASPENPWSFLAGDRNVTNRSTTNRTVWISKDDPIEWTADVHRASQGNVGLADGSVQMLARGRLKELLEYTGWGTNRILLP